MAEVFVAYGDSPSDTATLLLDAAEKAEQPAAVVRSVEGGFYVEEDLAKAAGVDYGDGIERTDVPAVVPSDPDTYGEPAAKDVPVKKAQAAQDAPAKSAAKKAPAKRAPAKKATAKKAAPKRSR